MRDTRGVERGECGACDPGECIEYSYNGSSNSNNCLYCNHMPTVHRRLNGNPTEQVAVPGSSRTAQPTPPMDNLEEGMDVDDDQEAQNDNRRKSRKGVLPVTRFPLGSKKRVRVQ